MASICKVKLTMVLLVALMITLANVSARAQTGSADRDNPTALAANTIKGTGVGKKVEYFYSFTAGPGEVVLTIDLKAKSGSTNADVEVFEAEGSKLFYHYPNATIQNEHAVKKFNVDSKQVLTLRLALDGSASDYSIKLGGAVELTDNSSLQTPVDQSQADVQPQTSVPAAVDSSVPKVKGTKLEFGMNILQTVGTQFGLPTSGLLHLVMKDGTVQDINLSNVKSASLKKQ